MEQCNHTWSEPELWPWVITYQKGAMTVQRVEKAPTSYCEECGSLKIGKDVFVKVPGTGNQYVEEIPVNTEEK